MPDHLAKLYNDVSMKADAMPISDEQKASVKAQMRNILEKASSENQASYLKDVFAFNDNPMIWTSKNLYAKGESVKNIESAKEALARFNIEAEKYEAAKSPEVKAREAAELKIRHDAILEYNREWIKKDAAAQRTEYENELVRDYAKGKVVDKAIKAGMLVVSGWVAGPVGVAVAGEAIAMQELITKGDDELEMLIKMKNYDNQPKDGNYPH